MCMQCTHWPYSGYLSGWKSASTPLLNGFHVLPSSSERKHPATDIPTYTRFGFHGSGRMACTILPPPPAFHLSEVGCCVRPATSYQSFPPLSLRKRPPGSTPHHRT